VRLGWTIIRLLSGLFCAVTCFFGFIGLMIANLALSDKLFPGIVESVLFLGSNRKAAFLAFAISCPIPIAICYVWYRIFDWIDKKLLQKTLYTTTVVTGIQGTFENNRK
jgi:hypothetical protein